MFDYDLVVVGAGSAGLVASREARRLGFKVLLIEKERLGGDCTNSGCIPSKTLIRVAKIAHDIQHSEKFGLPAFPRQPVNLKKVMEHVNSIIQTVARHDEEGLRKEKVELLLGTPSFADPHAIIVNNKKITSRFFMIATGSYSAVPEIPGIQESGFITHKHIFSMEALPKVLLVIGAGPIGVEMAQAFARLGSQVVLMQRPSRILPKEDPELAKQLQEILAQEGIQIYTGAKLLKAEKNGNRKKIAFQVQEQTQSVEVDEILISAGRLPNVDGLNLEQIGVKVNKNGIPVDKHFRTSVPNIYACGDCVGQYLFTHMAGYQAKIAVYHALGALPVGADYRVVPWATFSDPELARVGVTEEEARQQNGENVKVYRFPFEQVDRAVTEGETSGFIKIITNRKGSILGAHILGPSAGELIHEFVLAMQHGISLDKIAMTIHVYPTLSLGLWQTAEPRFQGSLMNSPWVKLFRLFAPKPARKIERAG